MLFFFFFNSVSTFSINTYEFPKDEALCGPERSYKSQLLGEMGH